MTKKIKKEGEVFTLDIDKNILDKLDIDEQTDLDITVQDDGFLVRPYNNKRSDRIKHAGTKVIDDYAELFKRLSKT